MVNNSEEIDFKQFIDGVKQKEISWKINTARNVFLQKCAKEIAERMP